MDLYLTPVPRGLHHVAISVIQRELINFKFNITLINEPISDEVEYCQFIRDQLMGRKVGTLWEKDRLKQDVSVGYYSDGRGIWSVPGIWEGSVWLQITTNAPTEKIQTIPVLGPLIACVRLWNSTNKNQELISSTCIRNAAKDFERLVDGNHSYDKALDLWRRHAKYWPHYQLPAVNEELKFRVSCVRGHSKDYKYERQRFLRETVDMITPKRNKLSVDLTNYDFEIVLLLLDQSCIAIGVTLRPNQLLGTRSFEGNSLPPDTSPPFLSGKITCQLTRLRPTTANLLLEIANVKLGDVVLDPCAGIGTIPFYTRKGVGLGGDISLNNNELGGTVAIQYIKKFGISNRNTNLCAWDAGSLPLRTSSVDVVVSDLPFGQQCLSSQKLAKILPLWFSELARVLRPGCGRIVLLCGAYKAVVSSLQDKHSDMHKNWNIEAVFPVNISGLLAWVVMAVRRCDEALTFPSYRQRLRKHTANRERNQKML